MGGHMRSGHSKYRTILGDTNQQGVHPKFVASIVLPRLERGLARGEGNYFYFNARLARTKRWVCIRVYGDTDMIEQSAQNGWPVVCGVELLIKTTPRNSEFLIANLYCVNSSSPITHTFEIMRSSPQHPPCFHTARDMAGVGISIKRIHARQRARLALQA